MQNLIQNARWYTTPGGDTPGFQNNGPAPDLCFLRGQRTRSLTLPEGSTSVVTDAYLPPIPVRGRRAIRWGYTIRAIEAQNVVLCAGFSDEDGKPLHTLKHPIGNYLSPQFRQLLIRFPVPPGAETVRLSMELSGRITACTYYAPTAYFCR